jgi:hypothetical protein
MTTYLKISRFVDDNLTDLVYDWNNKTSGEITEQLEAMINDRNSVFQVNCLTIEQLILDALVHDYIQKDIQK